MGLFSLGDYTLASGQRSPFKIDCDYLQEGDWAFLAWYIAQHVGPFGEVEGVPTGGFKLAEHLRPLATPGGRLLVVDDVWTTGVSMTKHIANRQCKKAVVFCRGKPPQDVFAVFTMLGEVVHDCEPNV